MSQQLEAYPHVGRPPGAAVLWKVRRRNGRQFDPARPGITSALIRGVTAWSVYQEHLRAFGHFSEFEITLSGRERS